MDCLDLICNAGRAEARGYRRGLSSADIDERLPYFRIQQHATGGKPSYSVTGFNMAGHDNEPRMSFICDFLQASVLPYVDPCTNVSGYYNVELHDSYSYLPNREDYHDCLTFSRRRQDTHMTLLPNPYQMGNYGNMNNLAADTVPWEKKSDVMYFAGSTTGSRNPLANLRVQACLWSLKHSDVANFRLTNIVQMSEADLFGAVPEAKAVLCPPVPLQTHFSHRYLVNIAGNTCAWSRVPMVMASRSVLMHMYHSDIEWFYPMMLEGTHFVGCAMHTLLNKHKFAQANPSHMQAISANANRFCSTFLGRSQAVLYTVALLEAIADARKP